MALTQIGSLNIGDLTDDLTIEKATGVYSRYGNIVHITDSKTDGIQAIITAKNVLSNVHHASLKDNIDTFDIELIGEQNYDEFIVKGNRFIIPAENEGEMLEFVIDEVDDRRSYSKTIEVTSYASYLDLQKAKAIEPFSRNGTAREHMFYALADTEHEVGLVESAREITISFENYTNPYEYLKRIAREFELELNFRIVHNGLFVTNRPVDALVSVGDYTGREVTFGKDLQEINRLETGDIYTALVCLGPEREDGSRLETFVEDLDALKRWGRPEHAPKHLVGVYEPQSEREDMTLTQLRQYGNTELNKRKNSVISYEVSFLDLEQLLGDDAKKIRKGDTIRIKDTYFEPNLYVEARVLDVKRDAVIPAQKNYILGDFVEYDAETIHDLYTYVKRELVKKAGVQQLLNYAEPKKVESDTAPDIKDAENPIWVDTSKTPYVAHVVNNGNWVKMTPTTPEEVNAYNKQQVDDKAQQALNDAKAFAENAENITEGVIDVGAIPLRTSVTGARLEWDGVNGFVQYDAQGNPVSWFDLEGNARLVNAYLTGRVEATEGWFGKNKRVTIGDDGLTIERPDGAIWMQNGVVKNDFAVSGFDPHMMDTMSAPTNSPYYRIACFSNYMDGFYIGYMGLIDGRSITDVPTNLVNDARNSSLGYTVRFQRYEFIHSARYLVVGYRVQSAAGVGRHRVRLYQGTTQMAELELPGGTGVSTYQPIIADLGTPTYTRKSVDLRVGALTQWNDRDRVYSFRVNRVYLTDDI